MKKRLLDLLVLLIPDFYILGGGLFFEETFYRWAGASPGGGPGGQGHCQAVVGSKSKLESQKSK